MPLRNTYAIVQLTPSNFHIKCEYYQKLTRLCIKLVFFSISASKSAMAIRIGICSNVENYRCENGCLSSKKSVSEDQFIRLHKTTGQTVLI